MTPPRRWIRLDVDWEDSPWLDALDGVTAGCWPRLLCLVKRSGVAGTMKAASPVVLARRWRVPELVVEALLAAAAKDGALAIVGDEWTFANWAKYQEPDSTNRLRQQAFRDRRKTGRKWSHGLSCEVCGSKKDLTRDHIVPHSHGGTDDPSNIRVLCRSCNSSRRDNLEWDNDVTRYPRESRVTPVTGAVTRHATETLTLTEELTPSVSPPRKPKQRTTVVDIPGDWHPSEAHRAKAKELGVDLVEAEEHFRDYHGAKGSRFKSWDLAFNTWLRNSLRFSNGNGHGKPKPAEKQYQRLRPETA